MTKEVFKKKCPSSFQPMLHPNNFLCYFIKRAISMKLLALSHHAEPCCQGQVVQNNEMRGQGVSQRAGTSLPKLKEGEEPPSRLRWEAWEGTSSSGRGCPVHLEVGGLDGAKPVGWGEGVPGSLKQKAGEPQPQALRFPRAGGQFSFWAMTKATECRDTMMPVLSRESPWHTTIRVPFARGGPSCTRPVLQGPEHMCEFEVTKCSYMLPNNCCSHHHPHPILSQGPTSTEGPASALLS